jgi:hypothetical protein
MGAEFIQSQLVRERRRALAWLIAGALLWAAGLCCHSFGSSAIALLLAGHCSAAAAFSVRQYARHGAREEALVRALPFVLLSDRLADDHVDAGWDGVIAGLGRALGQPANEQLLAATAVTEQRRPV